MKPYSGGVRHDYKDTSIDPAVVQRRHWSWFLMGLLLPVVTVSLFLTSGTNESMLSPPTTPIVQGTRVERPLALPEASASALRSLTTAERTSEQPAGTMLSLSVRTGDTLESLFRRNGLSLSDLAAMAGLGDAREHLRLLRPGDTIPISHRAVRDARGHSGLEERTLDHPVTAHRADVDVACQNSGMESCRVPIDPQQAHFIEFFRQG